MLKDMDCYYSRKNIKKKLLDTGLNSLKIASEKVFHKAAEFLRNKIADAVTKSEDNKTVKPDENPRNVEEVIIPLEKIEEILNKLRKVL